MRTLTDHEKRTVRIAAIGLAIYLVVFIGWSAWTRFEKSRSEYQKLVRDAQRLRQELQPYENRALLIEKLKEGFKVMPQSWPA